MIALVLSAALMGNVTVQAKTAFDNVSFCQCQNCDCKDCKCVSNKCECVGCDDYQAIYAQCIKNQQVH